MSTTGRRFHARTFAASLLAALAGLVVAGPGGHPLSGGTLVAVGLAAAGLTVWARLRPSGGSNRAIGRWDRRSRRNRGTASRWDIFRSSSAWAMRRRAAVVRPSLAKLSRWRRWREPVISYATPLCRVGRRTIWTSCQESTLRVGIPGTGKTAEMACRVRAAPGGVVVTSTAADLYELTAALRRAHGQVSVFNPGGIGGIVSTLQWSPLAGCTDPATASRRAVDLMGPGTGSAEGERWEVHGRRLLGVLLHAAALGGHRMADVLAWVADLDRHRGVVLAALARSPQAGQMRQAAEQAIDMTQRTRDGVTLAVAPAVSWVTQPAASAAGDPPPDVDHFTVAALVDEHASLYLLGDNDGTVAPLLGALLGEIAYQARAVASRRPGGRLDPALTLVLDEIAAVCLVPLDQWQSEFRKWSIVIHAACQGLGQLRKRWSDDGASMILNSAAAVLVFGGCKDANDLEQFGKLSGDRDEVTETRDATGRVTSTTTRKVPVIPPAMLAGLGDHRVLLVRRGMPVALARTPAAWSRRDARWACPAWPVAREARRPVWSRLRGKSTKAAVGAGVSA